MRCLLNDQRCWSHCLDTSCRWTGPRRISTRRHWDNVDARPGETAGPSVGKVLPDEIIDGRSVVHRLSSGAAKRGGASARTRRQRAAGRLLSANCQIERGHPHCECGHSLSVLSFLPSTRTLALSL